MTYVENTHNILHYMITNNIQSLLQYDINQYFQENYNY